MGTYIPIYTYPQMHTGAGTNLEVFTFPSLYLQIHSELTFDRSVFYLNLSYVYAKLFLLYSTLCDPMDCSPPGSSVHGFSRQEYWSGLQRCSAGDLPYPWIKPTSLKSPALAGGFFTTSTTCVVSKVFLDYGKDLEI